MIGGAHHVGLNVSDLDQSREFYRDGLGLDIDREFHITDVQGRLDGLPNPEETDADVCYMQLGDFFLELVEFHHPGGRNVNEEMSNHDIGKTHVCFEVVDADVVYESLSDIVDFINPPMDVTTNSVVTKGYDPDKNLVEFWEQPGASWDDGAPGDIVRIHHYGINVANLERALGFYHDTLGMEGWKRFTSSSAQPIINDLDVDDTDSEIAFLDADGCFLEIVDYDYPASEPMAKTMGNNDIGTTHFGIQVEDIERLYEEYEDDLRFVSSPQQSASGTKIVKCYDPDENVVEFIEPSVR